MLPDASNFPCFHAFMLSNFMLLCFFAFAKLPQCFYCGATSELSVMLSASVLILYYATVFPSCFWLFGVKHFMLCMQIVIIFRDSIICSCSTNLSTSMNNSMCGVTPMTVAVGRNKKIVDVSWGSLCSVMHTTPYQKNPPPSCVTMVVCWSGK